MNLSINCRCGTHFIIPNGQMKKITSFSCPVCNRQIPTDHLEKIKSCLSLIDECHLVRPSKMSSGSGVDLGNEFTIDFVE